MTEVESVYSVVRAESFIQCVWKFAVHLSKVLEALSTSVYTGLNPSRDNYTLYRYCTSTAV
jgi:hypothetical protein